MRKVPLFYCELDKAIYHKRGVEDSCNIKAHPNVKLLPKEIQKQFKHHINLAIDILRDNLDIEKL